MRLKLKLVVKNILLFAEINRFNNKIQLNKYQNRIKTVVINATQAKIK